MVTVSKRHCARNAAFLLATLAVDLNDLRSLEVDDRGDVCSKEVIEEKARDLGLLSENIGQEIFLVPQHR
jgi:hypothetical protein